MAAERTRAARELHGMIYRLRRRERLIRDRYRPYLLAYYNMGSSGRPLRASAAATAAAVLRDANIMERGLAAERDRVREARLRWDEAVLAAEDADEADDDNVAKQFLAEHKGFDRRFRTSAGARRDDPVRLAAREAADEAVRRTWDLDRTAQALRGARRQVDEAFARAVRRMGTRVAQRADRLGVGGGGGVLRADMSPRTRSLLRQNFRTGGKNRPTHRHIPDTTQKVLHEGSDVDS